MEPLTDFQERCERALLALLEETHVRIRTREVVGNGETFVHLCLESKGIEVWLYDDEAEYRAGRKSRNFEAVAFRDAEGQIATFIQSLSKELT